MRKKNNYFPYVLIILGCYFFIIQFEHPLIHALNTWPVLIIGIGLWVLFRYIHIRNPQFLFEGLFILLIGIHFYGVLHLTNWRNDWSIFLFIFGLSLLFSYIRTKKHLLLAITSIVVSMLFFFAEELPSWVPELTNIQTEIYNHWPGILIIIGILILLYNKK